MELHGDVKPRLPDHPGARLRVLSQDCVLLVMSMMDEMLVEMVGERLEVSRLVAELRLLASTQGMIFV